MTLILIRHLPTAWNRDGLLQGRRDLPILEPGPDEQAAIADNRHRLAELGPFDAVLVSRLQRTAMTADRHGYQGRYRVEPLLDELDFGPYEGRPRAELLAEVGARWREAPQQLVLGEALTDLEQRVRTVLQQYDGDNVLIFGHGAWIRAAVAIVREGGIEGMNRTVIDNNQLVIL
ncbi:histidine phosphatase family protein [Endothiovibrio diazotrophicus]